MHGFAGVSMSRAIIIARSGQPVVLAPGLFNSNAMESIASAMEISVIGARNVARLLTDSYFRSRSLQQV